MRFRWRDLLAVFGLVTRIRPLTMARFSPDPELVAVRGKRIEIEASIDLLRLEAQNLGLEDEEEEGDG